MCATPTKQADDVLDGLVRPSPQVVVELRTDFLPRELFGKSARPKVSPRYPDGPPATCLTSPRMLVAVDDWPACVIFRQTIQFAEQSFPSLPQVAQQVCLRVVHNHAGT